MKRVIWGIQAATFYLLTLFVAALPRSQSIRIGKKIGEVLFKILNKRRTIAIDNISRALPFMQRHPDWTGKFETAEEIALATFINLGISIVEVCQLYHGKGDSIISRIEIRGREYFDDARGKQRGLMILGGHCGNWELMSLSFKRVFDEAGWGIARHQNNPYLNRVVENVRTIYGTRLIYSKSSLRQILGVIKKDGVIGMLTDQAVFPENGALIEMLGRKAWANKAPVVIAHKTGVPLIPMFMYREMDRHILTIHPEYELCGDRSETGIQCDIQALSRYLESFICAHPADWYWVHRRWKRAGEPV